jgi:hypothetical protein
MVSDVITTVPAAGWYQDPSDPAAMRWWSGADWTDHVQPLTPPAPSAQPAFVMPVADPAPLASPVSFSAPSAPAEPARWTSNYTDDELTIYTSRGTKATTADATPKATMTSEGRTFISWDQDGDGIPDPPPPMGRAWALGALPLIATAAVLVLAGLVVIAALPPLALYAAVIPLLLTLPLSIADWLQLRDRGYPAPGLGWAILLGPVGHLARRISLLKGANRGVGPLVLYLIGSVVFSAAFTLSFLAILSGSGAAASAADPTSVIVQKSVADTLQTDLISHGQNLTVECTDPATSVAPNSTFTCLGTAADGTRSDIAVTIDAQQKLSYQVTPHA